ncbi:MAG: extracellular solute-binding protein [Rhodospirillaceae bacterium]|nr:extracellular solute-binding protein [Rhodospirillaceae bacterium]
MNSRNHLLWSVQVALAFFVLVFSGPTAHAIERGRPVHALALHGEPMYGPNFTHFGYVNPDAPKGGTLTVPNMRFLTFDTFNSFNIKGTIAVYLEVMHDSLMGGGLDEASTSYCFVCETVEVAPDNSSATFILRSEARFSDGTPITPEDVEFSFNILVSDGAPVYRTVWADVDRVEIVGDRTVTFHFSATDQRDLPLTVGGLPVLSKAYWEDRDFKESSMDIPVVSGAYVVEDFDPGRFLAYQRVKNYWAQDLPIARGMNNFDSIRVEYFRDDNVQFEAFKRGVYEFRREVTSRLWATGYDFPAALDGRVQRLTVPTILPMTVQHNNFNMRRDKFKDPRVRQAINYAYDFESLNRTLFYGLYERLRSHWQNSELEATGLPSAAELKILEPFRGQLPAEVFTQEYVQPTTDGRGNVRENLLKARQLLEEAGYDEVDGKLINEETGEQLSVEILIVQASLERVFLPFSQNLKRLGIDATLRIVDTSQYTNRINGFDFDLAGYVQPSQLSPGPALRRYFGSESADQPGSYNWSGVKNTVVDALIDQITNAEDRDTLVTTVRALDRVLQWNFYRLLSYGSSEERYAFWGTLKHPDRHPARGLSLGSDVPVLWWHDPDSPDNAEELVAVQASTSEQAIESTIEQKIESENEPSEEPPYGIIIIALTGVVLLLWSHVRRRNKK